LVVGIKGQQVVVGGEGHGGVLGVGGVGFKQIGVGEVIGQGPAHAKYPRARIRVAVATYLY